MTLAIVLTLFVRLGHEVFVYVQRTFGFVFLVATYHVFTTPGAKEDSQALNLYLAALATVGIAAFVYRSLLGNVLVRRRKYRVVTVNRLDEFVTEIVMEPIGKPLAFSPGQFLFVNFRSLALSEQFHPLELSVRRRVFSIRAGEIANQFHPFSITSDPERADAPDHGQGRRRLHARAPPARDGRRRDRRGPVRLLLAERHEPETDLDGGRNRRDAVPQHGARA